MKIGDAFVSQRPKPQLPEAHPVRNLCGPERIISTVRELQNGKLRLWNDPEDRVIYCGDVADVIVFHGTKELCYTIEKQRGRWTVTGIGSAVENKKQKETTP